MRSLEKEADRWVRLLTVPATSAVGRLMNVTISGSFRKHLREIQQAVTDFEALGAAVLSPAVPEIVDQEGDFLFVASDTHRSVRLVQDRHLAGIAKSDFLWLVCPDGYVGQSASMELGYAVARRVPVLSTTAPADITLRRYVDQVPSARKALASYGRPETDEPLPVLLDPVAAIAAAHDALERLTAALQTKDGTDPELSRLVGATAKKVRALTQLPTVIH